MPLLSIVVATKNRVPYCISCIESILSLEYPNFELVIQDNTDNFELKKYIHSRVFDKRLKYQYTPPPFSSIANFNAALELATGEYVCMIGDDDGINPEIIEATLWAKQNNVDALSGSDFSVTYLWEGTNSPNTLFTNMQGNTLTISSFSGKGGQIDLEKSLIKFMQNGCTNYLDFNLPKFYHGIIRKNCFELIKERTGAYIKGLSPDIYSSIALSFVINKFIKVDYPLTIPGTCGVSSSIKEGSLKNKQSKNLDDAPHFRDRGYYVWSQEVPKIYTAQTIWADSGFAAIKEMKRFDLINFFGKFRLYANIVYFDKSTFKMVINHIIDYRGGIKPLFVFDFFRFFLAIITGPLIKIFIKKRFFGRILILLKIKKLIILNNIINIEEAMIALGTYRETNKVSLKNVLPKIS